MKHFQILVIINILAIVKFSELPFSWELNGESWNILSFYFTTVLCCFQTNHAAISITYDSLRSLQSFATVVCQPNTLSVVGEWWVNSNSFKLFLFSKIFSISQVRKESVSALNKIFPCLKVTLTSSDHCLRY